MRVTFVTYEEAQKLIPVFKYAQKHGPWKEVRESASRILEKLESVRTVDYSPLKGYQMLLKEEDYEFYLDALDVAEGK